MKDSKYIEEEQYTLEKNNPFLNNLKSDIDLFDDESNLIYQVINVKRISPRKGQENWEIIVDGKQAVILAGFKLSDDVKSLLYTANGLNLLIRGYKEGLRTFDEFKNMLEEQI